MRTTNRKSEAAHRIPIDPHISQQTYDTLVRRLAALKKKKPALAKEVADLATLGDFSENFEYQQAKRELRQVHNQILKLEHRIATAVIITNTPSSQVAMGSTVTVTHDHTEKTFTILGSSEVNPSRGIISHTSPLGRALIGARVGDTVTVPTPTASKQYTILAIH